MKTFKAIFLMSVAMMFTFCSETPEEGPQTVAEISVSGISGTITTDAAGAQYPFTVTVNTAWTITTADLAWAQFSVKEGIADKQVSVTLTVPEYTGEQLREGTFTITAADAAKTSKTFTVKQSGVPPTAYDTHAAGHVFFSDDLNWLTALWPAKFAISKYGWPSVKVDDTEWNEYGISTDSPTADAFDTRGYVYDGPNTYCRYEGYIKLGRTAMVGSLVTPALSGIDDATVATLSVKWDASIYVTGGGTPDTFQQISISVSGNGTIASCGTDGATIDNTGKKAIVPILGDETHRFRWTRKEVIVVNADKETRIMFGASEEIKARCFVDNISITRAAENASAAADAIQALPALDKEISMTSTMPISGEASDVAFSVRINREWSISSNKEWLTVSKVASGSVIDGVVIAEDKLSATVPATWLPYNNTVLKAAINPDAAQRTATVTISADGVVQQTFTVTQDVAPIPPDPYAPKVLAQWNFTGLGGTNAKLVSWKAGDPVKSDEEAGAVLNFVKGSENSSTLTFDGGTSTQIKNRLRCHNLYLNDYWEFAVPVTNLAAGATVSFSNAFIASTQYGPKYWMEEYSLDNGATWTPAMATKTEPSATNAGRQVTYTHMLTAADAELTLDFSVTLPQNIATGSIRLRIKVCDLARTVVTRGDLTNPATSDPITYLRATNDPFLGTGTGGANDSSSNVRTEEWAFVKFVYTPAP